MRLAAMFRSFNMLMLVILIAIVAWVAEIDIVFQESAEEQESNQKSLVIEGGSSEQNPVAE